MERLSYANGRPAEKAPEKKCGHGVCAAGTRYRLHPVPDVGGSLEGFELAGDPGLATVSPDFSYGNPRANSGRIIRPKFGRDETACFLRIFRGFYHTPI